jgi:LiaI-LiaF-like transmembrane region
MKCANHPDVESQAYCAQCGRPLCGSCRRDVSGTVYCETCLATRLRTSAWVGGGVHGAGHSPGIALALGFIPGVGAIYNGQLMKGMVQVLIFGSLVALNRRAGGFPFSAVFGLAVAAFYFYMVIDSYQTARAKELGQPGSDWLGLAELKMNALVGAALLIGLGILFLLDNLGIPVFGEIGKFWPVLLIALGILLLRKRVGGHVADSHSGPTPAAVEPEANKPPGPQSI